MAWSLVLDFVVAILLIVTISYAIVLNRRLGGLRRDRAELEKIATEFRQATDRADASIAKLKVSTEDLQEHLNKAETATNDLSFLVDRGGSLADRLEDAIRTAREQAGPPKLRPVSASKSAEDRPFEKKPPRSEAERELMKALAGRR